MEESSYFYCIFLIFLTLWMHDFFLENKQINKKDRNGNQFYILTGQIKKKTM